MSSDSEKSGPISKVARRDFLRLGAAVAGASTLPSIITAATPATGQEGTLPGKRPPRQATLPQKQPRPDVSLRRFIELSETLTGFEHLDSDLASEYLDRCGEREYMLHGVPKLVEFYEKIPHGIDKEKYVQEKIFNAGATDADLLPAAEQLIYLWYVGGFFDIPRREIKDSNNPIVEPAVYEVKEAIQSIAVTNKVATVTIKRTLPSRWQPQEQVILANLSNAKFLEGKTVTINTAQGNQFTFGVQNPDYPSTPDENGTVNSPKTWDYGDPSHYFGSLVWPAIGVQPPILSGGNPGFWAFDPSKPHTTNATAPARRKAK